MNFEPPDFTKDESVDSKIGSQQNKKGGNYYSRPRSQFQINQDNSPLLRSVSPTKYPDSNGPNNNQQKSLLGNPPQYKAPIHNRLGQTYQNWKKNVNDTPQTNAPGQIQRNFVNRKRMNDGIGGPTNPKRKWGNKKAPYYKPNHPNNAHNSVQDRINRIRNNSQIADDSKLTTKTEPFNLEGTRYNSLQSNKFNLEPKIYNNSEANRYNPETSALHLNDSQEIDATDITVEVLNNSAPRVTQEDQNLSRFKMALDPKAQTAIRIIQQKRKDKQVIFPFPVKPNVTAVTLHDRFSSL